MTVRGRVLAVVAVVLVVLASAAVTLALLRGDGLAGLPGGAAEPAGSAESTRSLDSLDPANAPPIASQDATGSAIDPATDQRTPTAVELREFDAAAAMIDVRALEAFGVRGGGSAAEAEAAEYLRSRLVEIGLAARVEEFELPNGTTSRNVIARVAGSDDAVLVLGGHYDTKPPSPGANDNASGCAALLELAAILAEDPVVPTVEFVFFGSEEIIGGDPNDHHFGSRYRVSQLSAAERDATAGMISVDMIGYGPDFHSRTMGRGPQMLSDMLLARARDLGIPMTYRRDPGSSGWSDHESYELAGIPVSWIEWRDDPVYHTAGDTSGHLSTSKIAAAGTLVLEFARGLDEEDLATLLAR